MSKTVNTCGICLLLMAFLCSCMHTVIGDTVYFPEGTDPNSCLTKLIVDIHGAPARAYVDNTRKRVLVTFRDCQGRMLDHGEYSVEAGDLRWASRELEGGGVEVKFYENSSDEAGQSDYEKQTHLLLLTFDGERIQEGV